MQGDEAWLRDMLAAARDAQAHTAGMDRNAFLTDRRTQHAVQLVIVIIGEAAGKVSDEARKTLPTVPFSQIVRMRNRLVHHYFKVDPNVVWDVVEKDLNPLVDAIEAYFATGSEGSSV